MRSIVGAGVKAMRCSACGFDNRDGAKFCIECGVRFPSRCARCGFENTPTAKFCSECGAPLQSDTSSPGSAARQTSSPIAGLVEQPSVDAADVPDGERKTVMALFADIKGSTELMEDIDPEEARAVIDPALKLMIEAVRRYDGYVVQSTGDGIFALFGAPVAHEEHPQRALYAALAMQEAIKQYATTLAAEGRPTIEARVGVNTGEVVLRTLHTTSHTEYAPVGLTAHLAQRLQTVASVGSIAVSENTQRLVQGYFNLKEMGPVLVKGVSQPINVFEVVAVGQLRTHFELSAQRGLTKFVGREREVAEMNRALELARKG